MKTFQQTQVTVTFSTDKETEIIQLLQLLFSLAVLLNKWGTIVFEIFQFFGAMIELARAIRMALTVYLNLISIFGKSVWYGVSP